ncbi:MAG TPA: hypothetical protein VMM80_00260 [Bacteroidota bacterium]|nr:hypothetical protein [Bacteroidota bacterium]
MTELEPYDREASRTLNALGRSSPAGAPAHFADRVMRRLPPGGVPRRRHLALGVGFAIIGLIALTALDAAAILGARSKSAVSVHDAAVDSLAVEYDLTSRSLRTWE